MKRFLSVLFLAGCLCTLTACSQPSAPPTRPAPAPVYIDCPDCNGSGWQCSEGVCKKCKRCAGTGKVQLQPAPAPKPDDESDVEGKRRRRRRS